jgi:hypothetical protein
MMMQLFPMRLRICVVPALNVLTIDFENKVFNSDTILSDLLSGEVGKQIKIKDLKLITSETNERIYEWLHNWAGLFLDVQKMQPFKDSMPIF